MTLPMRDQEEIIRLAEQGYIISAIARETGYSFMSCKKVVEDWGIDISTLTEGRKNRIRDRKNAERDEAIRDAYSNTDATMRDLGEEYGITHQRIEQICRGVVKKVIRPYKPVTVKPGIFTRLFRVVGFNV